MASKELLRSLDILDPSKNMQKSPSQRMTYIGGLGVKLMYLYRLYDPYNIHHELSFGLAICHHWCTKEKHFGAEES